MASFRTWLSAALVALTGCDRVFSLDAPPDAAADGSVDAPTDAPTCDELATTPALASADTMLLDENGNMNPANRYGGSEIINIGQGSSSRVLWRFPLSTELLALLAPGSQLRGLRLTVTLRNNDCPGGCTNGATNFQVFAARNDWTEGVAAPYSGAAWYRRIQTSETDPSAMNWQVPGANGGMDRDSTPIAEAIVPVMTGGSVVVNTTLDLAKLGALRTRRSGGELSLIAVPTFGGTLFLKSREGQGAATLQFTYCTSP